MTPSVIGHSVISINPKGKVASSKARTGKKQKHTIYTPICNMKFTATAIAVAIAAASFDIINPVRGNTLFGDTKSGKRPSTSSTSDSLEEYRYTKPADFAGDYTQCSVSVTHSSEESGPFDNDIIYHSCDENENSSPVVFTVTKIGEYGAYKATLMPSILGREFTLGGWHGHAKDSTLSMVSFGPGEGTLLLLPSDIQQPVLSNDLTSTMTCSLYQKGVMECMAVFTKPAVPYDENREGKWLSTYTVNTVFVRDGFGCPSSPPDFCEAPLLGNPPITEDTVAEKCGVSYSGNIVVRLDKDLECRENNTEISSNQYSGAAITLSNGATLDCGGYELTMGDIPYLDWHGIKMFDTAFVRNCIVSKFMRSNAYIDAKNADNTFAVVNSTFSGGENGVYVAQDSSSISLNDIVLKDVTANSNDRDGFLFSGQAVGHSSTEPAYYDEYHTIKLEGEIRANYNGRNGMGLAWRNFIQVYGKVELKNNGQSFLNCPWCSVGGFYVLHPGIVNMTLIGDDTTFTSCNNTVYDMANMNLGKDYDPDVPDVDGNESVFIPEEGESWVYDTKFNSEGGRLPKNPRPCRLTSVPPAKYKCFRFTPVKLRGSSTYPYTSTVQLSEIELYSFGSRRYVDQAFNLGGNNPNGEGPEKAIDKNINTKWLNFLGEQPLILEFDSIVEIDGYRWITGNDEPDRDPIQWTFEGANATGSSCESVSSWTMLDDRSWGDQEVTTDRLSLVAVTATAPQTP